jgi:hypothetical protein
MPGTHLLVTGNPENGFTFYGPVTPNDPDLDEFTDRELAGQYWWHIPLTPPPYEQAAADAQPELVARIAREVTGSFTDALHDAVRAHARREGGTVINAVVAAQIAYLLEHGETDATLLPLYAPF